MIWEAFGRKVISSLACFCLVYLLLLLLSPGPPRLLTGYEYALVCAVICIGREYHDTLGLLGTTINADGTLHSRWYLGLVEREQEEVTLSSLSALSSSRYLTLEQGRWWLVVEIQIT